jgi:DNA-3-methyladenine glycosylase II
MARLIVQYGPCLLADRGFSPFQTLVNPIICQQLSAKAADTIGHRVQAIVPGFTPAGFLAVHPEALRAAGLSSAKARYIVELARRVSDGRLNLDAMQHTPDADVITALVELPGIGQWTADMFLIFGLRRPDVLSLGDVGLQRAARLLFGDDVRLEHVGQSWRPFCSVASWYLWRTLD